MWVLLAVLPVVAACNGSNSDHRVLMITVRGVVFDALSGDPLLGVNVTAGRVSTTTPLDGRFVLRGVRLNERVMVSSCEYHPAFFAARSGEQRIILRNWPTTGLVTGNWTHRGLQAHVGGAANDDTAGNGTFLLYDVCPGDSLIFSATNYHSQAVPVPSTRTITVELELARGLVPNVRGLPLSTARERIRHGLLKSKIGTRVPTLEHCPGDVLAENPRPGTARPLHAYITLSVAVPTNRWGYNFDCEEGNFIYSPPTGFCFVFNCIPNFPNGTGYVVQCRDGLYSKSGGRPGACSGHNSEGRALLFPPME